MSYSRWSNSKWYTFWAGCGDTKFKLPTQKLKNCQIFHIAGMPGTKITYGELMDRGIYMILQDVRDIYLGEYITEEEIFELKGYLLEFMIDVDNHFRWFIFFKYEWYYPIRNKLIWTFKKKFKKI